MPTPLCVKLLRCNGLAVEAEGIPLPSEGLVIGSSQAEGMLSLASELYVAPRHAEIRPQEGAWEVLACDARVLCVLNGQKVSMDRPQTLMAGDVIEVGFAALGVEAAPCVETYFQPLLAGRTDIPDILPASTAFSALDMPEGTPALSGSTVDALFRMDTESTPLDLLQIIAMPNCEQKTPDPLAVVDCPIAPVPPPFVDSAESLVNILVHDLGNEAGKALTNNECPLLPELDNAIPLGPQDSSAWGTPHDCDDSNDILQQLARESERNVAGIPSPDSSALAAMFASNEAALPAYSTEDPLAMLGATEESLTDILEGHMRIDDVLASLGNDEAPFLLEAEQWQPDPLLLLTGKTTPMSQHALTDILYQDHHTMTMGTPYHQSGKAVPQPIATDRRVRLQEDTCLPPPTKKQA